jgi:hypothetical protein
MRDFETMQDAEEEYGIRERTETGDATAVSRQ